MEEKNIQSTDRLLRVIVALLLRQRNLEPLTLREQIELLADLSLKPKEIASIIGRSSAYVNKELSSLRKSKRDKKD